MTDNAKRFLEFMSTQDKETLDKIFKMEKEDLISYASEQGITLTDADLEKPDEEGEVSLDEADAVAGGAYGECECPAVGNGPANDEGESCYCVVGGGGPASGDETPCWCIIGGGGTR